MRLWLLASGFWLLAYSFGVWLWLLTLALAQASGFPKFPLFISGRLLYYAPSAWLHLFNISSLPAGGGAFYCCRNSFA
jgi:hypothetical protein